MEEAEIKRAIEAILFAAGDPVGVDRMAIAIGSPVCIPYFFAGIDFATTMPVRFFGSPPIHAGISLKSCNPCFTLRADSHERNALFTSI